MADKQTEVCLHPENVCHSLDPSKMLRMSTKAREQVGKLEGASLWYIASFSSFRFPTGSIFNSYLPAAAFLASAMTAWKVGLGGCGFTAARTAAPTTDSAKLTTLLPLCS